MGTKISKHYFSHSFGLTSTKLYDKCDSHGGLQTIPALCDLPQVKKIWRLKLLLTQDHIGLKISKRYSHYNFHPMSAKLDIGYHGGIQAYTFWQSPKFKNFVL